MRKYLYVTRTRRTVDGIAESGEISPQGVVTHTEDWDGRISAEVLPATNRYVRDPDGHIRTMTFKEMVDRGYFHVGRGPKGVSWTG